MKHHPMDHIKKQTPSNGYYVDVDNSFWSNDYKGLLRIYMIANTQQCFQR
jgi:hypothetical protein